MQRWEDGALSFSGLVATAEAYLAHGRHLPMSIDPQPVRPVAFDHLAPEAGESWTSFDADREAVLQALWLEQQETARGDR
jgi:hypothetical protein